MTRSGFSDFLHAIVKKKLVLFILLIVAVYSATAQAPMFSYVTATTTTANTIPMSNATSRRCQFLYKPADFPWALPGNITKLYIRSKNAVTAASWTDLTIKMGTSTKTALTSGTFEGGLTTVYTAPTTTLTAAIPADGWFMITLQTPFNWNRTSNLLIDISQTAYTGNFSVALSSIAGGRLYGGIGSTTGTAAAGPASLGFDLETTPCAGTPAPGTVLAAPLTPCLGSTSTLRLTPYVLSSGIDYQWEEWNGTAWVNAAGGTGANTQVYTTPPVTTTMRYRAKLTCTNGPTAISYTPDVTVTPAVYASVYTEDFESITANNELPNCMTSTNLSTNTRTYTSTQTSGTNHTPGGSKFASFYYSPVGTNAFFTPNFTLQAGKTYLVTFWYYGTDNSNTFNACGVYYGTSNSLPAMINPIGTFSPTNTAYKQFSQSFTPTVTGTYYIGIVAKHTATLTNRYVNIDDIGLKELPACTGKPDAGVITAVTPCANQNFTLETTGGTSPAAVGNLTFQWQDSTNAGWQNSVGISTNPTLTANINTATKYRLIVRCAASSLSDTSDVYNVVPASFINCYCTPTYATGAAANVITNVKLNEMDNSSSGAAPWYLDYTPRQPVTLKIPLLTMGATDTVFVKHSSNANNYSGVWIDFDHSGSFETTEFFTLGTNAGANGTARIPVTPPVNALPGITRMRIRGGDRSAVTAAWPCNATASAFGEAEDYLVNIRYPLCNGALNAGVAYVSDTAICAGYTIDVWNTTHEYKRTRISWQWQNSIDGGLSWNDMAGTENKDSLVNVLFSGTIGYRLKMVCDTTGDISYSVPVHIRQKKGYQCYCYSQSDGGKADSSDIGAVVIGNMTNASGGPHINNPRARRRTDFTDIPNIVLSANGRYRLAVYHTLSSSAHSDARVSVFIDFNNDLVYNAAATPNSELVYSGVTTSTQFYLDTMITIPNTLVPNVPTGMRVIINNDMNPMSAANQGCGAYVSGETEDYVLMFTRVPQSVPNVGNLQSMSLFPNPTTGRFAMTLTAQKDMEEVQARVYSITGQTISQRTFSVTGTKFTESFDLGNAARGVYFVEVRTADGDRMVQRVVLN